ncbi:MAG TPA: hypothetical protein VF245_02470 [Solirubrobacterales bacterium]
MAVILLVIVLLLIVTFLVGYLASRSGEPNMSSPVDPEQEMKAAVELHRIRRNLDVAWARSEQRRAGAALRRNIRKALEDEEQ